MTPHSLTPYTHTPTVLGIDLGGTKISAALFSTDGMITEKEVWYLEGRKGEETGELTRQTIDHFLYEAKAKNLSIHAIGVAVPGIYFAKTGKVWAPNIKGWEDYPLLAELEDHLKDTGINIGIDSDRACYILGEIWKGSAQGCKDAIFLAVGTGIGAGILINGQVLRGANDIAGAIGWMALTDPWLEGYETYGCFEYHASGPGLARMGKRASGQEIFAAFEQGNAIAKQAINDGIVFWGKACANLVSLFNPEIIIFGGGVFGPAAQFLNEIYLESKKWAQPISIQQVSFKASGLGDEAGLYGAGYLALS